MLRYLLNKQTKVCDRLTAPKFVLQVSGVKNWSLRPPPECWWSCPKEMNVTLYPGDVIVVNTNWLVFINCGTQFLKQGLHPDPSPKKTYGTTVL
jgi:hypothetical protein